MGPEDSWTPNVIRDELAVSGGALFVWGLLIQAHNPLGAEPFLERFLPDSDVKPLVGLINVQEGKDLCNPSGWSDPKLLNFGSEDIKVYGIANL